MTKENKGLIILIPGMVVVIWYAVNVLSEVASGFFYLLVIIIFLLVNLLFAFFFSSERKNVVSTFITYVFIIFPTTIFISIAAVIIGFYSGLIEIHKIGG